jgi:phytoene dehydrogenase-like protein
MKAPQPRILIVGAGLAGLAAAKVLIEKGFEVKILEARDRVGGRISSDETLGVPLDRGAAWIHGTEGNPIATLAQQFQAKLVPFDSSQFLVFDRDGQIISTDAFQDFEAYFAKKLEHAKDFALEAAEDLALAAALSRYFKPEDLSPREQDLFR